MIILPSTLQILERHWAEMITFEGVRIDGKVDANIAIAGKFQPNFVKKSEMPKPVISCQRSNITEL